MPGARRALGALLGLGLLLGGCGGAPAPSAGTSGPALWRVEKDGLSATLFGTIHVLPDGTRWETPRIEEAVGRSDRLVLEVAGIGDDDSAGRTFAAMGQSPGLPPISARVPAQERADLRALMGRSGMSEAQMSRFESWAAAMLLSTVVQADLKLHDGSGVEPALTGRFRQDGKPIAGLETVADQFGAFDRLPEAAQRTFLTRTVIDAREARSQYDVMLKAWLTGDVERIAAEFVKEIAPQPQLLGPLLTERNHVWAERIAAMRGRPFIAVGAGHLAGQDNVIALLAARGYRVDRLQ